MTRPIQLQRIIVGTIAGDNTGDPGRDAFIRINENYDVLELSIEDAERKAFVVACTDENETIEDRLVYLGDDDFKTFRIPYGFVLVEVRASLKTPDAAGDIVLDILEEGVSVLDSGLLVVPAGGKTSVGYSPDPLPDPILLEDDNEIVIQHVNSPTGGAAAGLDVTLIGYVIWTTF